MAINQSHHGREPGVDLDLCDVCYWRTRYETTLTALSDVVDGLDADDLESSTGLQHDRCEQIISLAWIEPR